MGGAGFDTLAVGLSDSEEPDPGDRLLGGPGGDLINGGAGPDRIVGGRRRTRCPAASAMTVSTSATAAPTR